MSNRCRGGLVNQAASAFRARPPGQELSAPDIGNALYYHTLGTSGSADRPLSANRAHPDWQYEPHLSRDGRWLVVEVGRGEVGDTGREDVYIFDLEAGAPSAVPITQGFDASYLYVGTDQGQIYFLTTLDAPRGEWSRSILRIRPATFGSR